MAKSFMDCDDETKFDELSLEDQESLKLEIKNWPETILNDVHNVLADYFNIMVSNEIIIEAMCRDLDTAFEVWSGSARDTFVRDGIIDNVLKTMSIGHWPCNGDSDHYKKEFHKALTEKIDTGDLTILG